MPLLISHSLNLDMIALYPKECYVGVLLYFNFLFPENRG